MNNTQNIGLKFTNEVTGLSSLQQYSKTLESINTALSVYNGYNKSEVTQVSSSLASTNDSAKKTSSSFNTLLSLGKATAFYYAIKKISSLMSSVASKSASYLETYNLMQVAYDGNTKSVTNLTNRMSEMYGLDENWVLSTASTFKQLSNAMGLADETGTKLANVMTQLSVDISSLYNVDVEQTVSDLESGLAGMTKPVRKYGADITQASLQQTLLNNGISDTVSNLSYAEKRLVIVTTLLNQTKLSQGDWGKTIESVANQMRVFNEQINRLTRALGNVFLPVLKAVLPYMNGILMVLVELTNIIAKLFGYSEEEFGDFGTATVDTSVVDLTDDLDGATASANKLKTSLRSFDKLNNITTPTVSSGTSGTSAGTGIDPDILSMFNKASDSYLEKLDSVKMKATEIRDKIMETLGFTKYIDLYTGKVSFKYNGWQATLGGIVGWFLKLNTEGKIFVGLGVTLVLKGIYDTAQKIMKSKFVTWIGSLLTPTQLLVENFVGLVKNGNSLSGAFNKTTSAMSKLYTKAEKTSVAVTGIVTAFTGVSVMTDAIKDINSNGLTLNNTIQLVAGTALTAFGTVSAAAAIFGTSLSASMAVATAGISVLIGLVVAVGVAMFTSSKSADDYAKSIGNLNKEATDSFNVTDAQISHTKDLEKELLGLVDSNGKVKESDQDRAEYIITKLNDAYDLNLAMIDGKITKNGEEISSNSDLQSSIDDVIEKKRLEAYVNAYEDQYAEALKKNNELMKEKDKIEQDNTLTNQQKIEKLKDLKSQYEDNQKTIEDYENLDKILLNGTIDEIKKATKSFYSENTSTFDEAMQSLETTCSKTKTNINNNFGSMTFNANLTMDTSEATSSFNKFGTGIAGSGFGFQFKPVSRYKSGLDYVPYDYYPAYLDEGERVLTKQQNVEYSSNNSATSKTTFSPTIVIQVGNKELAKTVLNDLESISKDNGKPITIGD